MLKVLLIIIYLFLVVHHLYSSNWISVNIRNLFNLRLNASSFWRLLLLWIFDPCQLTENTRYCCITVHKCFCSFSKLDTRPKEICESFCQMQHHNTISQQNLIIESNEYYHTLDVIERIVIRVVWPWVGVFRNHFFSVF